MGRARSLDSTARVILFFLFSSFLFVSSVAAGGVDGSIGFNESLLLRPMKDGKLLMQWQFEVRHAHTRAHIEWE